MAPTLQSTLRRELSLRPTQSDPSMISSLNQCNVGAILQRSAAKLVGNIVLRSTISYRLRDGLHTSLSYAGIFVRPLPRGLIRPPAGRRHECLPARIGGLRSTAHTSNADMPMSCWGGRQSSCSKVQRLHNGGSAGGPRCASPAPRLGLSPILLLPRERIL